MAKPINILDNGKIIIYQTQDGQTSISVKVEDETVWLTANQMAMLFGRDEKTVRKHINNVFAEKELEKEDNTHFLRVDGVKQPVAFYDLDVIISVGYRVKSQRGTQFRIWANRVLKEYLVKGYVVNHDLAQQKYEELSQLVKILGRTMKSQPQISGEESGELINVVADYTYALDTLDRYDYQRLAIDKTFGGVDLYPSVEEKAAMLLYLVTKNHSFSDGNKRIAATLFLWFMQKNGILYHADGTKRIADGTLVALTLMIAESRTEEKDVMVKVVVNLINKNN